MAEKRGIATVLDKDLLPRRDQDVVVDCTGRAEGLQRALEIVRPRGTIVLKTTVATGKPMNMAPIVIHEITLLGSRCGPFPEAVAALGSKQVDVFPLISRRVSLEQAEGIFANPVEGLKIIINIAK